MELIFGVDEFKGEETEGVPAGVRGFVDGSDEDWDDIIGRDEKGEDWLILRIFSFI